MGDKKMPAWPVLSDAPYAHTQSYQADYERARAEAAMARLRVALTQLSACEEQLRLLMHRGGANPHMIHATWQNAADAIKLIAPLPPQQTEGG